MRSLEELRIELDGIDDQMTALFEQRMKVCQEVAEYKIKNGRKVLDKTRENAKLTDVASKVTGTFNKKGIQELYEQLMSMSRKLQYQRLVEEGALGKLPFIAMEQLEKEDIRVVFQGVEGAYSQAAVAQYFGESQRCFPVATFRDAMIAIEEGSADFAVLPIENSTAGSVTEVYDLLVEFENYIVGELILPVSHTLAAFPGTKVTDIKTVFSHPQGLMQCEKYLEKCGNWQQISVANTAVAAQRVLEDQRQDEAAICSEYAARIYGLEILDTGINDERENSTRFIVVTNQKVYLKDAGKISLTFEIPHQSGSLYRILSHFIYNDLNMSRIESRPIEGRNFEYRFFVDVEGNLNDPGVKNALRGLREEALNLRILGNY